MTDRVIYLKGGRAIEEARRLFPRVGDLPDGGPDKFLLAVLFYARTGVFRLTSFGPRTERVELDGHEVVEYGARSTNPSKLRRRWSFARAAIAFVVDTLQFRPRRVLCGADGPFALFALGAARLAGAQFVFLAHNAIALPTMSKAYLWTNRFICQHADWVVAHGPFVRDEAIALGAASTQVLEFNNALDPEHAVLVERLPAKGSTGDVIILYVGRVEEDKGVLDLLEAFRQLPVASGVRLRFVGNGSVNATLRQLVHQYQLQARVEVFGPVEFEAVFAHMKLATVVVTPSQSRFPEGFCKSAMEALYVGTPVIAPDYGPFPYMVKHEENGLLYSADNVASLTLALQRCVVDTVLRHRLEEGASHWGQVFMHPKTTFARAIEQVFLSVS